MRAAIQLWNPNRAALGGRAHASLTKTQPIDRSEPHGVLATPALAVRARTLRASLSLREIERAEGRKKEKARNGLRETMFSMVSSFCSPWRTSPMAFALLFRWDPVRRASTRARESTQEPRP
jgi:hypothetical protein